MARTKKATKEVVEQTTTESINVENPVDLEQAAEQTETAETELANPEEEQAEPDKVSEVMDHELAETEQEKQEEKGEENEENPEQNEPEPEEQEEPKVGFEKWIASQVVNNPITWNRANYVPQVGTNNHDQTQNVRVETARRGVSVKRI